MRDDAHATPLAKDSEHAAKSRPLQLGGAASSPPSTMQPKTGTTHCQPGEMPVFSCTVVPSLTVVSLCVSSDQTPGSPSVRFIAGVVGKPHVEFANDPTGETETRFERTSLTFAGGTGGYAYSAGQGDEVHVLYSISGDNGLERQGAMLTDRNVERALSDRPCIPGSIIESDEPELLKVVSGWPSQVRLEKRGLPPRSP